MAEAEKMIHQLEKESREKARAAGELSDTSSLSEETSGDEGFVKQRKTKKKVQTKNRFIQSNPESRFGCPKNYYGCKEADEGKPAAGCQRRPAI